MKTPTLLQLKLSKTLHRETGTQWVRRQHQQLEQKPSAGVRHSCLTGRGSQVQFSNLLITSWLCGLEKLPWVCEQSSYFRASAGEKIVETQTCATDFQTNASTLQRVWALTFDLDFTLPLPLYCHKTSKKSDKMSQVERRPTLPPPVLCGEKRDGWGG